VIQGEIMIRLHPTSQHRRTLIYIEMAFACMMSLIVALYSPRIAAANTEQPLSTIDANATIGSVPQIDSSDPAFGKTYAFVATPAGAPGIPVFASPAEAAAGANPINTLAAGYNWVTLHASAEVNGMRFVRINNGGWIAAELVSVGRASQLQGRIFARTPERPFAWVLSPFQPTSKPNGETNNRAPAYQRYDMVPIWGKALVGTVMWYRIGEDQWVRQTRLAIVSPRRAPQSLSAHQRLHSKWISVNIFEQTVAAYEGERMVFATVISSGLPKWETPRGVWQVWAKNRTQAMYNTGGDSDRYYLEDVPDTMYFFQDYALHGAYWHDQFGSKRSHGCVNMAPKDARWLFGWTTPVASPYGYAEATAADPGTWVWVY
jgi:hypothetical protein